VFFQWSIEKRTSPMLLTTATVAALLIASPSVSDADRIAANGGFLLGNAHRCGVETARIERAGRTIRGLIAAAAADGKDEDAATTRFAEFFLVSSIDEPGKKKLVAACPMVKSEFAQLEQHPVTNADAGE
jgi:hypothetical protein